MGLRCRPPLSLPFLEVAMSRLSWVSFGISFAIIGFISMGGGGLGTAHANSNCQFSVNRGSMVLQGDCTTDATIAVPDRSTLNGQSFTITAVDPPGGHFRGAVVRNAGAEANVRNLRIATRNLGD